MTKTAATVGGKEYTNHYTYTKDKLTQVKHNTSADASGDVAYNFEYDALGRPTVVKVGNQVLSTTTYNADGTVQRVDYGNEDYVEYSYDEFKRTKGVRYGFDYEDRYVYEYGANGQAAQLTNTDILTVTTSEYVRNTDAAMDTLLSVTDPRGQTVNYAYDQNRKVTKTTAVVDGKEYVNQYTYTKDKLTQVKHNTSANAAEDVTYHFEFDAAGRPASVKVGSQLLSKTTYNADGTVKQVDYGNEDSIQYTYDAFKRLTGGADAGMRKTAMCMNTAQMVRWRG